jgi:MOSC domain-containing protein YiiM
MRILAVNVAKLKVVSYKGKEISTGIYKKPVHGSVLVRKTNIDGDAQADLNNHGGVDQAVYAFPHEHYVYYQKRLEQQRLEYGHFGENLTTEGMLESEVRIGDQFRIGEAVFEVSQPRSPCFKFAVKMGKPDAVKVMLDSGNTGFYLRVVREGMIEPGQVTRVFTNEMAPTVAEAHQLMYFDFLNVSKLQKALGISALSNKWRDVFATRLNKLEIDSETD